MAITLLDPPVKQRAGVAGYVAGPMVAAILAPLAMRSADRSAGPESAGPVRFLDRVGAFEPIGPTFPSACARTGVSARISRGNLVTMGSLYGWLRSQRASVEHAITDLGSSKRKRRSDAAIWIWSRKGKSFTPEERSRCIEALRPVAVADPDPATRAQAIAALVSLKAPRVADLVLAALKDPDWGVRMIVAGEMGPMSDPRVVDALVRLLEDEDGFVREHAAIGLECQGDPRALGPLRAMVENERDVAVRQSARHAIRVLERL